MALVLVVAPVFALCLLTFAALHLKRTIKAGRETREPALSLQEKAPELQRREAVTALLSPTTRQIAYVTGENVRLHDVVLGGEMDVRTPALHEISHLAWFPDGVHLLVSGIRHSSAVPEIWMVSTTGSDPLLMRSDARLGTPSPSGKEISFVSGDGREVWVMDSMGTEPRRVLHGQSGDVFSVLLWTYDGKTLLLNRYQHKAGTPGPTIGPYKGTIPSYVAVAVDTGLVTAQETGFEMETGIVLKGSQLLFFQGGDYPPRLGTVWLDPITGAFRGAPILGPESPSIRSLSAGNGGSVLATVYHVRDQVVIGQVGADASSLTRVSALPQQDGDSYPHAWTPEGEVLLERRRGTDPYHIFRQKPGDSNAHPLVEAQMEEVTPRLTPGSRSILFAGRADSAEPWQLFRIPAEGGRPVRVNTDGPLEEFRCPSAGTRCLLRRAEDHRYITFYALDPVQGIGLQVFRLPWLSNDLGDWSLSPDGKELAVTSPQTNQAVLNVIDLRKGKVATLTLNIRSRLRAVNWAPDGKGWYAVAEPGLGCDIYFVRRSGKATLLHHTLANTFVIPSPDGHQVAFVGQKHEMELRWVAH